MRGSDPGCSKEALRAQGRGTSETGGLIAKRRSRKENQNEAMERYEMRRWKESGRGWKMFVLGMR